MSQVVKHFRELVAWQKAMVLARAIYHITNGFPREERFGLVSQMRRSAVSIPSNIAEGQGRSTRRDFRHFLFQARGSLYELETQLELAAELGFASVEPTRELLSSCDEVARILNGLIRSLSPEPPAPNHQPPTTNH